jgi:hypothetical protein
MKAVIASVLTALVCVFDWLGSRLNNRRSSCFVCADVSTCPLCEYLHERMIAGVTSELARLFPDEAPNPFPLSWE